MFDDYGAFNVRSGLGHAGSQTAPLCNPRLSKSGSPLWFHIVPDAPERGRSAPTPRTSVALLQGDPGTEQNHTFLVCNRRSFILLEFGGKHLS